jgi:hypothetical protein
MVEQRDGGPLREQHFGLAKLRHVTYAPAAARLLDGDGPVRIVGTRRRDS